MEGLYADDYGCAVLVCDTGVSNEYRVHGCTRSHRAEWTARCRCYNGEHVECCARAGGLTVGHFDTTGLHWEDGTVWRPLFMSEEQVALLSRQPRLSLAFGLLSWLGCRAAMGSAALLATMHYRVVGLWRALSSARCSRERVVAARHVEQRIADAFIKRV